MVSPAAPLVLIGAGNMGGAMLTGWLESGIGTEIGRASCRERV